MATGQGFGKAEDEVAYACFKGQLASWQEQADALPETEAQQAEFLATYMSVLALAAQSGYHRTQQRGVLLILKFPHEWGLQYLIAQQLSTVCSFWQYFDPRIREFLLEYNPEEEVIYAFFYVQCAACNAHRVRILTPIPKEAIDAYPHVEAQIFPSRNIAYFRRYLSEVLEQSYANPTD